jgi:hypothetical protein
MSRETESSWPESGRKRRVTFDPTINLGHILTAIITLGGALSAGTAAWNSIDKRIASMEQEVRYQKERQHQRDDYQDQRLRDTVISIKETIERLEKTIEAEKKRK